VTRGGDDVAAHELEDGLVLDAGEGGWFERPAAQRLAARVGEGVEGALAGLAGSFLRADVAELFEALRLGVQPRGGHRVVEAGAAAVHVDEVVGGGAAVADQRQRQVGDVVEVAGHPASPLLDRLLMRAYNY
jgi:hypothetical protein